MLSRSMFSRCLIENSAVSGDIQPYKDSTCCYTATSLQYRMFCCESNYATNQANIEIHAFLATEIVCKKTVIDDEKVEES